MQKIQLFNFLYESQFWKFWPNITQFIQISNNIRYSGTPYTLTMNLQLTLGHVNDTPSSHKQFMCKVRNSHVSP